MSKAVWPDPRAGVNEMQTAKWYLTATLDQDQIKLRDLSEGEAHSIEFTAEHALRALDLALDHAAKFRLAAWRRVEELEAALTNYGAHDDDCAAVTTPRGEIGECDCGYLAALDGKAKEAPC